MNDQANTFWRVWCSEFLEAYPDGRGTTEADARAILADGDADGHDDGCCVLESRTVTPWQVVETS